MAVALLVGAAIVGAGPASGQETSVAWTQPQGGAAHAGIARVGPAPAYRQAWRFDPGITGRFGVSTPVVAGDVAITVAPHTVYGVALSRGTVAWSLDRDFGPPVPAAVGESGGRQVLVYTEGFGPHPPDEAFPSASPSSPASATPSVAVSSSSAPAPSSRGSASSAASASPSPATGAPPFDSRVQAVDLATQRPVWDAPVALDAISRTGVTIDGDTAYVGDGSGTVTAIDLASGTVRWTHDAPGPVVTAMASANGTLVLSTQPEQDAPATVVALHESDGSQAWLYQPTAVPFLTTIPAISGDTVFLGLSDRTARAVSLTDGTELWSSSVNTQFSSAGAFLITPDAIVAADVLGEIYAFDPATGARRWDHALNAGTFRSAPVAIAGTIVVTTERGSLLAVDAASHDLVARASAAGPQGFLGSMAVTPDLVIAVKGGHAPGLVAFAHDPAAPLLAVRSPTVLRPGSMVVGYLAAALPFVVVLGLAGRWLVARMGPAFEFDQLPEDAWEPDDPDDEDEA